MQQVGDDALGWALALQRMPGQRLVLRQRPLPSGLSELLSVASGAGSVAAPAAARLGEPVDHLVEAARFYAREILLAADADAYRTLGVTPDADHGRIKSHFRLLQRWLHPDRRPDGDAVFAQRVNQAWDALRTPSRRRAYDETLASHSLCAPASPPVRLRVAGWDDLPARQPRVRWWTFGVLAVCVALAVLAVRDVDRGGLPYPLAAVEEAAPPVASPPPAWRRADAGSAAAEKAKLRQSAGRAGISRTQAPGGSLADGPGANGVATLSSRPGVVDVPDPPPAASRAAAQLKEPAPALERAAAPDRQIADPLRSAFAHEPPAAPAAAAIASASTPETRLLTDVPVAPKKTPAASPTPGGSAPVHGNGEPRPEQVASAALVGRSLLAYLADSRSPPPPIWNNPGAQAQARAIGDALRASGGPSLAQPDWRVGTERARLSGTMPDGRGLQAQLVWREDQWLVSAVHVEERR